MTTTVLLFFASNAAITVANFRPSTNTTMINYFNRAQPPIWVPPSPDHCTRESCWSRCSSRSVNFETTSVFLFSYASVGKTRAATCG